jgi:hypothetical protein
MDTSHSESLCDDGWLTELGGVAEMQVRMEDALIWSAHRILRVTQIPTIEDQSKQTIGMLILSE